MERFSTPEHARIPELSFSEKLAKAIERNQSTELTVPEISERLARVTVIENEVENLELQNFLSEYGIRDAELQLVKSFLRPPSDVSSSESTHESQEAERIYSIDVRSHFSVERLPADYAYSGGAARSLLLRSLGIQPDANPRDVDVIRFNQNSKQSELDRAVASHFMFEDAEHGFGVRIEPDEATYFSTRDLTINEVYATDKQVFLTESCLRDTVRRILRLTPFQNETFASGANPSKMLAKLLRFYAQSISENDPYVFADLDDYDFERSFISPFWLALQYDRAFEVSPEAGEQFFLEMKKHDQIPDTIATAEDATEYLLSIMSHPGFYYRHAPGWQFELEDDYYEEYDQLPSRASHRKPL